MGTHAQASNNASETVILEQYADVQDDGYISDEDIEEYPETFMPRPRIMSTNVQGQVQPQQPEVARVQPHHNTEQRLEQGLHQIRRVLFLSELEPEDESMPLDGINLNDESVYIPNDSRNGLMNRHQTDICASTTNTRTDANISEHQPTQIPQ